MVASSAKMRRPRWPVRVAGARFFTLLRNSLISECVDCAAGVCPLPAGAGGLALRSCDIRQALRNASLAPLRWACPAKDAMPTLSITIRGPRSKAGNLDFRLDVLRGCRLVMAWHQPRKLRSCDIQFGSGEHRRPYQPVNRQEVRALVTLMQPRQPSESEPWAINCVSRA